MLQVSKCLNRAGGHGAAILRRGRQPPRHAVRELGERGGKARRAYLQGGRSLQGDGVHVVAVMRRKLKPETYLLQEENGNLFMNTGFRIDVSYNEATDVLTFSPNGDYVRVKPQPGHPTEE